MKIKKGRAKSGSDRQLNRQRLINANSTFDVVESYKEIRTNIVFSMAKKGCKVIAISSSVAGEGKSTTCFNTAITFAETKSKILVMDCDLRRPNINKLLDIDNSKGLSNVLVGEESVESVIKKTEYPCVDVITRGVIPPNPAELISSEAMEGVVDKLRDKYDYILVDTPPVYLVTDTMLITKYVDGVIMVVRQNFVERKILQDCVNKLKFADAKLIGFIFNDVDMSKQRYNYKAGYEYR